MQPWGKKKSRYLSGGIEGGKSQPPSVLRGKREKREGRVQNQGPTVLEEVDGGGVLGGTKGGAGHLVVEEGMFRRHTEGSKVPGHDD